MCDDGHHIAVLLKRAQNARLEYLQTADQARPGQLSLFDLPE